MKYEVLCPPLSPSSAKELADYKVCWLSKRPAFLKIEGGRLSEEGFLKEVRVDESMALYKGSWALLKATLDLIRKGEIEVVPLAATETPTPTQKPITEKQRKLLIALMKELNIKHPIPGSRKDASTLIKILLSRKRTKKKKKVA